MLAGEIKMGNKTVRVANFNPIGVNFETIDFLVKQDNGANAIALYMAYAAICHWQRTYRAYANESFMMKRLSWGRDKLRAAKKVLTDNDLVQDIPVRNEKGQLINNYIQVNHMVTDIDRPTEKPTDGVQTVSTLNYKVSTLNEQSRDSENDFNKLNKEPAEEHQTFPKPSKRKKRNKPWGSGRARGLSGNLQAQAEEICLLFEEHRGGSYRDTLHIEAVAGLVTTHTIDRVREVTLFVLSLKPKEFQVRVNHPRQLADKWAHVVELMQHPPKEESKYGIKY